MIVTIDGPAGAGKSSVAEKLARRLGYRYLNTGAMYRGVTLFALRRGIDLSDPGGLAECARSLRFKLVDSRCLIDDEDISAAVNSSQVTDATHHAATNPQVREHLVQVQRELASGGNIVCDGRDQGTVVFPDAELKIFLTASAEERARRRVADLVARNESADYGAVLAAIRERDARDEQRTVGPLCKAQDAVELPTDHLTEDGVVDEIERLARARLVSR